MSPFITEYLLFGVEVNCVFVGGVAWVAHEHDAVASTTGAGKRTVASSTGDMNKRKREVAREVAEQRKAHKAAFKAKAQERAEVRAQQVEKALKKPQKPVWAEHEAPKYRDLLAVVSKKTPRLMVSEYKLALSWISKLDWHRDLKKWKPKGKGRSTVFRSLCDHLVAKYPLPVFLWSILEEEPLHAVQERVLSRLCQGESFFKICKEGDFPIPLTRRQCHNLMQSPASSKFMDAVRRVQVQAEGGSPHFHQLWVQTNEGRTLHNVRDEAFWLTVIRFFAQNPMLDLNSVRPLLDYINHRRQQEPLFTMKGRTAQALLRNMEEWHNNLARTRDKSFEIYPVSGLKEGKYKRNRRVNGNYVQDIWEVKEILNSKVLNDEGRAMRHCVYSYGYSISRGYCSIWSLMLNDEKMVTLEVRNEARRIVQARGKFNRSTTSQESVIISDWARENDLTLNYHW